MSYRLNFVPPAWNEWKKLDPPIQSQLGKKLKKCRTLPHIPGNRLYGGGFRGLDNVYKIKLRASGYRLVYHVDDKEMVILVLSVGKRERGVAYKKASERLGFH